MAKGLKRFPISSALSGWAGQREWKARTVCLTQRETHHLKNVLRLKEGALCLLFDREGNEFISRLERFREDGCSEARLMEPVPFRKESLLQITVAQAIPQDRTMDEIVGKAAELDVFELIPLVTERTVVRMANGPFQRVRQRWERIGEQTLKQSRGGRAPRIAPLTSFEVLCSDPPQHDRAYLLHPSLEAKPIRECLLRSGPAGAKDRAARILLMIGPEGGFSSREVEQAKAIGVEAVTMGIGILKANTAFVAAVSFFRLMYP